MAYENRTPISYSLGTVDFGAGNTTHKLRGPAGFTGRIVDVHLDISEAFTQDTTPGYLRVGTTGDADAFAELTLGTTAAINTAFNFYSQPAADKATNIPADTLVFVAGIAPTGGTPAGIAKVTIVIDWWK